MDIHINTGNAAFHDSDCAENDNYCTRSELARILLVVVHDLHDETKTEGLLYDINGNRVGTWKI